MTALKEIFQARKQKPFADLFDFCIRVPQKVANRKTLEALVHSGAFDEFGKDRSVLLATLDVAAEHAQLVAPDDSGQFGLFGDSDFKFKPKYTSVDPIRVEDKLALEKAALGIYLSTHPVSMMGEQLSAAGSRPILDYRVGERARLGVYITEEKKIRTKKGEAMAFFTLSDPSGELEAVAFPAVFKRFGHHLIQGAIVLLDGKIDERDGKKQFIIQAELDIPKAAEIQSQKPKTLFLGFEPKFQNSIKLNELKVILKKYKGDFQVILHYAEQEKTVLLSNGYKVDGGEKCLRELRSFLGEKNVVLKK